MTKPSGIYQSFSYVAVFVIFLWVIAVLDLLFALDLYRYGVYPRRLDGLVGILFGPLIHGSFTHLFSNTLPLLVLGTALIYGYPRACRAAIPLITLGAGVGVWILGRSSFHIGASGVTVGMMTFVFLMGIVRWEPRAIALSCLVFFLYGGMIWGIFPAEAQISFEYHFFGALAGAVAVWLLRDLDPRPVPKRYDWEGEDDI